MSPPFPEGGLVKVCLDDPFLDAKGNPTGMYHLAGEFCPEDRCSTVSVLDFERQRVSDSYSIGDDIFTKEYLVNAGEGAYCTVHTEPIPLRPRHLQPGRHLHLAHRAAVARLRPRGHGHLAEFRAAHGLRSQHLRPV